MPTYEMLENPALVRALAHPLRARMLYVMQERPTSPKEMAAEFGVPLSNVAYHVQILRKLKLIKLVRKTPRRGAIEHHYTVNHVSDLGVEAWAQTPSLIKESAVAEWLKDVGEFVTSAAATGGFNRGDAWLARSRLVFDQEGWGRVAAKLTEVLKLADEEAAASAERLKKADHEGEIQAGMVMMLFESSPSVPEPDAAKKGGAKRKSRKPAEHTGKLGR
jgi:DNA-binding transcriptional ArsR family regulator